MEAGKPARDLEYNDEENVILKNLHLLTAKPMLYILNTDEAPAPSLPSAVLPLGQGETIQISAKLESELADLSPEEARQYLKELGMNETGLDKLIVASYKLLNLVTFLTSGEPETRAWTVKQGTSAPQAAGVIHTDFIKGFVKADVCDWRGFVQYNGWAGIKTSGKLRLEGREYVIQDGDVCYFHIAT